VPDQTPHSRLRDFEQEALPHLPSLFNLALKLTRNRADAEGLVQDTYLRAYRSFGAFEPGTEIRAWLFTILRNAFLNRRRAARALAGSVDFAQIEGYYEQVIEETFLRQHHAPTPEEILLNGGLDGEVENALASLPEEYRTVVVLALQEEMSYREIAAVMSIPVGTVMSRLHRGRKLLQVALLDFARRRGILRRRPVVGTSR
jgi:RNA polymerase sigma-70 factor (ECF subfamily)